jgi:homogentisate 1,2-dioxygenase
MPRGENSGGPNGGGRPLGSKNKRTIEIALQAAAEGITPIEVMLKDMWLSVEKKDWGEALKFAEAAAPYIHPRLAAVQHSGSIDSKVTVEEGESARCRFPGSPGTRSSVQESPPMTHRYVSAFGNDFETEALPGALPQGQNSPQRCAMVSGTPFGDIFGPRNQYEDCNDFSGGPA